MSASTTRRLTSDDELLGMRLAHRVMRRDAARLSRVADEVVTDSSRFDQTRYAALAAYIRLFAASIHHHHKVEDEALWPLIKSSAGPHVDLSELSEDHQALDPILDELATHSVKLPEHRAVVGFARALHQLREVLDEHIDDEERTVFPLVTGYVSAEAWRRFEKHAQRGGRMDFDLTRAFAVMTPDEAARTNADIPLLLRGIVRVLSRRQSRRERAVFDSAD